MKSKKVENMTEEHRRLQEAQVIGCIGSFEWKLGEDEVVWSDEMYRIMGMEPQEENITLDRTNKLIHPDDFHKVHQVKATSVTTPGQYEITHRILLDDGTVKWVNHRFESVSDQGGKVARVHGSLQDVTKWKVAEQELLSVKEQLARHATDKYMSLIDSIDQGFCTITLKYDEEDKPLDYQFIEVSPSFEQQTGIKDAAGKWMRDIAANHEEFWFKTYGRIAKDRKPERFEHFSTPLKRWWSVYAFPINEPELRQIGVLFNDITEQIRDKKKVEESEKQFRNVLVQSPNIFVILQGFPEMIITFANEPLFKSWGRTAEIIGKPLLEVLPEIKDQPFPKLIQRVFETGETYNSGEEKAVIIKNGVPVDTYYVYVYQAIFDDHQKVTGVTIMATDITEQVLSRKKIEENEKELQNIFLNAPAAISIFEGPEHKYILANKAYEKLSNRKAEDLLGKSMQVLFPELKGTGTLELFDKVLQTGESFSAPEYALMLDLNNEGVLRQYYFNFSMEALKNSSGEIYAVMAMTYDITEQVNSRRKIEESEKRFSNLLLESPFAVAILKGKDMVVALANDAIKSLWGKGSNIEDKPLLSFMPEIEEQGFASLLEKVYTTGEPFYGHEVLVKLQRNGIWEEVYFNFIYQPYKETGETISGVTIIANEVTTQAIANKKIAANEQSVSRLFMDAPAIICVHRGPQHVFELSNKIHQQVLGNRAILGKPVREAMPDLEGSGIYELLDRVYSTGEPFVGNEYPVKIDRGNGKLEEAYFNFIYQPTHNSEGKIDGLLVHGVEVTEQVLLRKKIEANKNQLQNIFLNAPAAISIFEGPEHKYILANKAYEKLSNRKAEDLLGKSMQVLFPELKGTGTLELFDKVLQTGESFSAPEYALMLDLNNEGVLRKYYLNFSMEALKNSSGEIYAVMAVTYDITEQVEAVKKIKETEKQESYLLKLSDALKELINPVDIKLTACRILGEHVKASRVLYAEVIDEEQLVINNNYVNGVSPIIATINAEQYGKNIIDRFKRNEKVIISDINTDSQYDEDAKRSFLSLDVVATVGIGLVKGGKWVATFGMHYNAPREWTQTEIWLMEQTAERTWAEVERAKADEKLRESEEEYLNKLKWEVEQQTAELNETNTTLRYANENLQQFASIASHDLQEPLRKLKLFASILKRYDAALPEEAKEVIQKISNTSGRMRQLITDVLQYSKIAYGRKEFERVNLQQVLQNVMTDLDLLIEESEASIHYNENLPEIEAVPHQMNQLFYNLLTNAFKFRRENEKPDVRISYRMLSSGEVGDYKELDPYNKYIEILFSDNGIGFNPKYGPQIFEIFERLHSTDKYEGTGVGLALCKKIIENHNGHLFAKSLEGEGAKFYILLPITQKRTQGA